MIFTLAAGLSVFGYGAGTKKKTDVKPGYQKVCVQKSKKTGKCLKYETRKITNTKNTNIKKR
nr:hypothetical protein [Sebaldella sp. S0638]